MSIETRESTPEARYARILQISTRLGLAALIAGFLAYVAGLLGPRVLASELPALWARPARDYLAAAGITPGWGWIAAITRGDTAPLIGIALIALNPVFCLLGVLPIYLRARDRHFVWIIVALVVVLALAASGRVAFHL